MISKRFNEISKNKIKIHEMAIKMLYTSRNLNLVIPRDHSKQLLTHE
jgi:hypothetical protein